MYIIETFTIKMVHNWNKTVMTIQGTCLMEKLVGKKKSEQKQIKFTVQKPSVKKIKEKAVKSTSH